MSKKIIDGLPVWDERAIRNNFKSENSKENTQIKNALSEQTYLNGVPIHLNRAAFQASIVEWLSNVAAADLISTKNIDSYIVDFDGQLDRYKTSQFDELLKQNYLEIKIYELAKRTAKNGISGIWFMPRIEKRLDNLYSLNSDVNVIQLKIVNNEIQIVKFLTNLVQGLAIGNVYALVTATKEEYKTHFYECSQEQYEKIDWSNEDSYKEYERTESEIKSLESFMYGSDMISAMNQKHNLGVVPFFPLFFNESYTPLINQGMLQEDFDELYSIACKMYDEANMMGTKVKWVNDGDINLQSSQQDLINMIKILGSIGGIFARGDFNADPNDADADLITKPPIYSALMDAFKNKLNFILKKIGLSSDTDSKGTVQQSVGEIVKQNEFSYNNQNFRNMILQNYLQNLIEQFFRANFTLQNAYKVKVLSTQSLGMSEMEKLNYVIMAKSNGLIDTAKAISIITGKNYIDSYAIMNLQDLKEDIVKPDLMKNHNTGDNDA